MAQKLCFVVGPIGDDDSDDRVHADWLLEDIIEPVFAEFYKGYRVSRADKITDPGRIDTQIITALLNADLVIADLTTLNANAFYEIGIRHAIQKPIIHMHLEGQRIPFDVTSFRSIKFSRARPKDIKAARVTLREFVGRAISADHEIDNPVTFSRGKVEFEKTATPSERVMQEQLEIVAERLSYIEEIFGNVTNRNRRISRPFYELEFPDEKLTLDKINIFVESRLSVDPEDYLESVKAWAAPYFKSFKIGISRGNSHHAIIQLKSSPSNSEAAYKFQNHYNGDECLVRVEDPLTRPKSRP